MIRRLGGVGTVALLTLALSVACGRGSNAKLMELQRVRAGNLDVLLLAPKDSLQHGKDTATIEFRSASDGKLVDVGSVHGSATMPMGGMPMLGGLDVQRTTLAGQYQATVEVSMAGTWRLSLQWEGPSGQASANFSSAIQ